MERKENIIIEKLNKSYGNKKVLTDLSLKVYEGELFGFIGRNGIGKSTTIDCMIGMKKFDSGTIKIYDYDIKENPIEIKKIIGYVSSEPILYEEMTGIEYLKFIASIYKVDPSTFKEQYVKLCERLEFKLDDLSFQISGYSHGMKQKISLIASIIHNPKIWILDEPTVGLDFLAVEELKKMMVEYTKLGNTVFLTSHNIDFVSDICNRVAIINKGNVKGLYDLDEDPIVKDKLKDIFIKIYDEA
ncbi:MAG: ABC transporter ATP-binding protein [Bacilli bacterium]|nr:ABC transporter ATP-binding protein [Bacilli bacterium]